MTPENIFREQEILEDVYLRTGLRFIHIAGIPTRDKTIAETVLPILREWAPRVSEDSCRDEIYSRFLTPHASPHMDVLMEWWQGENYPLASECLAQALAVAARPSDGQRLWDLCRSRPRQPSTFKILARLTTFPAVASDVKDALVAALDDSSLTVGDLQYIAAVDDPRIDEWFERHLHSPNRYLRTLAKRVVELGRKLPRNVVRAAQPPDRQCELYSAEVDIEELSELLKSLSGELRIQIPVSLRKAGFLSRLETDRWVVASINSLTGEPLSLWFRMEDVDAVEVVITKDTPAGGPVQ